MKTKSEFNFFPETIMLFTEIKIIIGSLELSRFMFPHWYICLYLFYEIKLINDIPDKKIES